VPAVSSPLLRAQIALFALLAGNTWLYVRAGTAYEGLDSVAWLALLALFALEAAGRFRSRAGLAAIRGLRLALAAAVAAATVGYFIEQEWLDAANSSLWIAMVAVLEIEVRGAAAGKPRQAWLGAVLLLVCVGLGAHVLVWAVRGDWFDAYDAALWLAALVVVERSVTWRARAHAPG
jgi:hypothetical protein